MSCFFYFYSLLEYRSCTPFAHQEKFGGHPGRLQTILTGASSRRGKQANWRERGAARIEPDAATPVQLSDD